MSNIAYPVLSEIEEIVEDVLWKRLVDIEIAASLASVPWLNIPVIRDVYIWLFKFISSKLYSKLALCVDLGAIQLKNKYDNSVLDKEAVKLHIVATNYGIASSQFKAQKEVFREKFKTVIRFGATL